MYAYLVLYIKFSFSNLFSFWTCDSQKISHTHMHRLITQEKKTFLDTAQLKTCKSGKNFTCKVSTEYNIFVNYGRFVMKIKKIFWLNY